MPPHWPKRRAEKRYTSHPPRQERLIITTRPHVKISMYRVKFSYMKRYPKPHEFGCTLDGIAGMMGFVKLAVRPPGRHLTKGGDSLSIRQSCVFRLKIPAGKWANSSTVTDFSRCERKQTVKKSIRMTIGMV